MPGEYTNVVTPEGTTVSIPTDAVASTLARDPRYRIEGAAQAADRAAKIGEKRHLKGPTRAIEAGITSVLSGATLGGFDGLVALTGQGDRLGDVRREHSAISTGGEILGALLTAIPTGGGSIERQVAKRGAQEAVERIAAREAVGAAERTGLREVAALTPSGALSGFAARVAEKGAEKGAIKSTAYKALGGAIEGAGQSVGAYVSDVALGDRDLSAEGLAGAVKTGSLLGGGTSAVFGVSERALARAKDLFPRSQITRELAEQSEVKAASAVTSMMDDAAELERRAQAKLDDIKAVRGQDPAVQAHAAQLRIEREAKAAAQRAQAEARALAEVEKARAAGARADLSELRLDRAKNPPPRSPRGPRMPKGTPSDGVPETIIDDAALVPASDEVSDLERALLATSKRIDEGASIDALNLERRGVKAVDDLEDAVVAADPSAAKLRQLVEQTRIGREGVQEYLAAFRKRADDLTDAQIAKGVLKRDDDVIRTLDGGRDVFGAKLGAVGNAGDEARGVRSRLRKPYTDEELIAKAERNPTFVDAGDVAPGSAGSRMSARDDLVERIVSGKTSPKSLQVEDLLPQIDEATGEVLPGLRREMRAATGDDIIRAVEANRRDPKFASYVSDDVMRALRGRLDMPDDLAQAIPAISALEKAEADLAEHLGAAAPPASVQRAADLRAARASHAEARTLADAQKIAAIDDVALPVVQDAVAKAEAADIAAGLVPGGAGEKASKMADVAAAIEVMSSLGIPGLPNASNIPIVGPVLGLYLKARAGMGVWRKFGGKMPASVESIAARKSAQTRERVATAVRSMLDGASKTAERNAIRGAATAEILSRNVFGGEAKKRYRPTETMAEMWERHRAEIAASKQPGAIERVLRERVPTGDPRLAQSLASLARRRLAYLDEKMPRPPPGGVDPEMPPWHPTEAQAEQWASIVDATDDPAAVLERAAAGDVSVDQVDAVRRVFPKLFAEAQLAVIEGVAAGKSIPYQRRVQLGAIFGLPLAPTQDAEFAAAMQAGYAAPPPDAPTPRPSANVDLAGPALLQEQEP